MTVFYDLFDMKRLKVPDTYVLIFTVLLICAASTWLVPGGEPQTWQVFSALYEGFTKQAGIIAFVLMIGGAFWLVNSTKAVDEGIMKFISKVQQLERFSLVRKLGVGNIVITLVMLLFGLFGAVFGMSEETIAFVAVVIPLARSLGYDDFVGVCMVYVAAHVGFAGAMLNPFTIGIAQGMADLPLFSGIEYRVFCWVVLMLIAIVFVLWYASKTRKPVETVSIEEVNTEEESLPASKTKAWICYGVLTIVLAVFSVLYADGCVIKLGQSEFTTPWLLPVASGLFALTSLMALRNSVKMFILNQLLFTIVFLVIGAMGYGWYLPEICALFMAMAISAGFSAGYSADKIAREFIAGAKDIFSAALIIGFAAGMY